MRMGYVNVLLSSNVSDSHFKRKRKKYRGPCSCHSCVPQSRYGGRTLGVWSRGSLRQRVYMAMPIGEVVDYGWVVNQFPNAYPSILAGMEFNKSRPIQRVGLGLYKRIR